MDNFEGKDFGEFFGKYGGLIDDDDDQIIDSLPVQNNDKPSGNKDNLSKLPQLVQECGKDNID